MATETRSTSPPLAEAGIVPLGLGNGFDQPLFDAMLKMQANAAKRVIEMNEELLRFTTHRLHADDRLMTQLLKPQAPGTLAEAWSRFMAKTVREYAEEYRKFWSLALDQAAQGAEEAQNEALNAISTAIEQATPHTTGHTPV